MDLKSLSNEISKIVEQVKPSVVTVSTLVEHPLTIFGYEPVKGFGSGFVVSKGYIVTNAHVIRDAAKVTVSYVDGYASRAVVVAEDPTRDLALLETEDYGSPIKLGDSSKLKVGEIVLAVGSPLGLFQHTVTLGVVSATGRTIVGENIVLEDLIQTDAAINPGNSGGPLINLDGEAVGVTTAIIPFAQGIGFAIPINTVKRFIGMIEKYGRPLRAWIGVYVAPLNPTIASVYNIPVKEGLLVVKSIPGTPAYRRGIREGDVIIQANNVPVTRSSDLKEIIEDSIDKGFVNLLIQRGSNTYSLDVEIIVQPL
ncbi:trypsin-like peptidase domain-containing protein [Thermosphaera chiliense]|uniref:Trypsin-like peptidase domain-containing protein n=1 Tax=Thermosphaera chiliense TaxID=3402707 RepID=A0A7M1USH7_9CREN|nr:trypsin-like peptidase domain-containing protein [Thermosphaera aggregans]QOR93992.1 trypsin-like peptidase domain-containing protein [Thermosphaera aggregans]